MNRPKESRSAHHLRFVTSAVDLQGCPADAFPEVAIVGRSNAGKSSLINSLASARIAQVSGTPGKTRLLNFYQGPKYRLVDMPGYGFAARSGGEQRQWIKMIETFLAARENLIGLILVMDIRRDWSSDEKNLLAWLQPRSLPALVVATKSDKLSRSEMLKRVKAIREDSGIAAVLPTSALSKDGVAAIEAYVYQSWIRPLTERASSSKGADDASDEGEG